MDNSYIIYPDNILKLLFDIMGFILMVMQYVTLPFTIAFDFDNNLLKDLNYLSDIFFIVDVILNFFCGYYKEGVLILNRREIISNYLRGWFAFDLLSSFPYSFIFDSLEVQISVIFS
jgi:hypothetical protein